MKIKTQLRTSRGFTLVELMVTLVIGSLIATALYSTYILQQRSYQSQSSVTEMQQNVRAGLDYLVLDLRMAGYDPLGKGVGTIETATRTTFKFTADMDENGEIGSKATPASEPEIFEYAVDDYKYSADLTYPVLKRSAITKSDDSTDFQPMADYIDYIEFVYLDKDGKELTSLPLDADDRANVRSVIVTIIARTAKADTKYTNTNFYILPSGCLWQPGGATCPAPDEDELKKPKHTPDDNFRRRVITTQVDLRNMGL